MLFIRKEGWKGVKPGRIFEAESVVTIQQDRRTILQSDDVRYLGDHLGFLAKLGNRIDPICHKGFIADRAKWIWNWVEDSYPQSIQMLDFFQAMEKVSVFSKAQYTDTLAHKHWVGSRKACCSMTKSIR